MRSVSDSVAAFLVLLSALLGWTQPAQLQTKHARVELLASSDSSEKGALLGVHFILEKGWHVYWINPGDSGQPPSFTWKLPAGFNTGEILWPRPHRLQTSPTIADYGYEDDALFIVPLHGAPSSAANSSAEIELDAKWLICREICIPDHAELKLPLASLSHASASSAQLFSATRKLLPQPWPKGWKASAESRKDDFVLTVTGGKTLGNPEFFPIDAGQIENAARQRVEPTPQGAKIVLRKSDLLLKPIANLRGVLVIPGKGAYLLQASVASRGALK